MFSNKQYGHACWVDVGGQAWWCDVNWPLMYINSVNDWTVFISLSLSLSLCASASLYQFISVSLCVALCLSVPLCVSLCLSVSHRLLLSLSHSLNVSLCFFMFLYVTHLSSLKVYLMFNLCPGTWHIYFIKKAEYKAYQAFNVLVNEANQIDK